MKTKTSLILTYLLLLTHSYAELISTTGTTLISDTKIQIVAEPKDNEVLSFTVEYPDKSRGGLSNVKVVKGKWRAAFEEPNKLWVYDGDKTVHLSERTHNPSGYKASSSTIVPDLLTKVPKELKAVIPK